MAFVFALGPGHSVQAREKTSHAKTQKKEDGKKAKGKETSAKSGKSEQSKAVQLGTFGEWGAYATQGKSKTCYALAQPKTREPASVKRNPAYIFISTRPAENVKSEISFIMGFPMKDGAEARAEVGSSSFSLIAKGSDAWVKNPAEEGRLIEAMKRHSRLTVKATSTKGKTTTDTYVLSGLGQALDKVRKECR
ncbi:invasion associated locus B family protein [Candidatus Rhodoblastus alkanivorans]|nr:invasion associated locus B family protein [Candidatus Rhodoblastus alkanivorans]